MEKANGSATQVISKYNTELEIAKYRITFPHFHLCFIYLNDFHTLTFLGNLMNLKATLCLPAASLVNFPFSI